MFIWGRDAPVETLPEQEELRRRLRAARALRDLTVEKLAERIPAERRLGVRTLRKLESGERELTADLCRQLATYIGVPYEWFTVEDVAATVGGSKGGGLAARLAAVEASQAEMWAEIRSARGNRRGVRHEPPASSGGPGPVERERPDHPAPAR
jgi:transcriptional regulator with XRE-family HTH domain